MAEPSPLEIFHQDFLSDRSYRERQILLIASAVVLAIVKTGLVPTKISSLGIELTLSNQQAMLRIMAAFIAYLLLSFCIHAWCDYLAYKTIYSQSLRRAKLNKIDKEKSEEEFQRNIDLGKNMKILIALHQTMPPKERVVFVTMRRWFDLGAPVLLSIAAIWLTLTTPARPLP